MSDNILDGFAPQGDFAKAHNVCERTVARYRKEPDGLPYMTFGGRIFIHVAGARGWLERRVRRPNPTRDAR
jgi:hypothetical protein